MNVKKCKSGENNQTTIYLKLQTGLSSTTRKILDVMSFHIVIPASPQRASIWYTTSPPRIEEQSESLLEVP